MKAEVECQILVDDLTQTDSFGSVEEATAASRIITLSQFTAWRQRVADKIRTPQNQAAHRLRKPLPRVRKPNLHSDRGQDSNLCARRPLGHQSTHGSTVPRRASSFETST
ncbi:hypothetical protein E2C01_038084 [Portunus trituberculatus]|uniref:Uncharacterized protein n=1 Tax=Portunus trituberculatus TaxID=210409 RepID=A0A5B7FB97_PORTR|nr:hypothetical protein [Portunus trituberculatus]